MGAKQIHDEYGKKVLKDSLPGFNGSPDPVPFGKGCGAFKIDGTIDDDIAVEIESRASKQVRGAIIDIIFHPYPKKLLVLINAYSNKFTGKQCEVLLKRFASRNTRYKVVTLEGNGKDNFESFEKDKKLIHDAVRDLRRN